MHNTDAVADSMCNAMSAQIMGNRRGQNAALFMREATRIWIKETKYSEYRRYVNSYPLPHIIPGSEQRSSSNDVMNSIRACKKLGDWRAAEEAFDCYAIPRNTGV